MIAGNRNQTLNTDSLCLCGSTKSRNDCCGPYLDGTEKPKTAEALMRSRFCAFASENVDYLLNSWDLKTRPKTLDLSKDQSQWQRLEILNTKKGSSKDKKGLVEFKAYFLLDNKEHYMHEISRFQKTANSWFYLDGSAKAISHTETKKQDTNAPSKNSPCPCGSGKKYKRCCGA
jgi:SEC-C motif-containing protein